MYSHEYLDLNTTFNEDVEEELARAERDINRSICGDADCYHSCNKKCPAKKNGLPGFQGPAGPFGPPGRQGCSGSQGSCSCSLLLKFFRNKLKK